jgi:hypothetical protein
MPNIIVEPKKDGTYRGDLKTDATIAIWGE